MKFTETIKVKYSKLNLQLKIILIALLVFGCEIFWWWWSKYWIFTSHCFVGRKLIYHRNANWLSSTNFTIRPHLCHSKRQKKSFYLFIHFYVYFLPGVVILILILFFIFALPTELYCVYIIYELSFWFWFAWQVSVKLAVHIYWWHIQMITFCWRDACHMCVKVLVSFLSPSLLQQFY